MKKIFVIGGGKLQTNFIKTVRKNGYEAIVFDRDVDCEGSKFADKFFDISIENKELIFEIARTEKPIAIHSVATEQGNVTACFVGEKLGLDVNSYLTAINTSDKSRMKEIFILHCIPTARSKKINSPENIDKMNFSFPFVVKASDRSAGRGVSLVNNKTEFLEAYNEAYKESFNKVVLIEEYIQGEQYSLETISHDGIHHLLGVTREFFLDEIDFVESHHLLPALNEEVLINSYATLFYNILDAFDIRWGACHIEFRIVNGDIKIIEIASRMGGLRDVLLFVSKGVDYNQLILNSITKNTINIHMNFQSYALAKLIYNSHEVLTYLQIENREDIQIFKVIQEQKLIEYKRPKSLIDSIDFYYLSINSVVVVNEMLKIWRTDNHQYNTKF